MSAATAREVADHLDSTPGTRILRLDFPGAPLEFDSSARQGRHKALRHVAPAVAKLLDLEELCVSLRGASRGDALVISGALAPLEWLRVLSLDLSWNELGPSGARDTALALRRLPRLTALSLDLSRNPVGAAGVGELSQSLAGLVQLRALAVNLTWTSIGRQGAKSFASAVASLPELVCLDLSLGWNSLGPRGVRSVAEALEGLRSLSALSLRLARNGAGRAGARSVALMLGRLELLTELVLDLSRNSIGQDGAAEVSAAIGRRLSAKGGGGARLVTANALLARRKQRDRTMVAADFGLRPQALASPLRRPGDKAPLSATAARALCAARRRALELRAETFLEFRDVNESDGKSSV